MKYPFFSKLCLGIFDSKNYLLPPTLNTFSLQWDGYMLFSRTMVKMPIQFVIMRLNIVHRSSAGKSATRIMPSLHCSLAIDTFASATYTVNCYPSVTPRCDIHCASLKFFFFWSSVRFPKLPCNINCIKFVVLPFPKRKSRKGLWVCKTYS